MSRKYTELTTFAANFFGIDPNTEGLKPRLGRNPLNKFN
jgi:hypothetical protein